MIVQKKFRGYLEKTKYGYWQAFNIDLSLYAVEYTIEKALSRLHNFTLEYIDQAYGLEPKHCNQLMNRKAPFLEKLKYKWFWLKDRLGLLNHDKQAWFSSVIQFTIEKKFNKNIK
jgi:hypothetical protein